MAQFPRTEPEIENLAGLLISGLRTQADKFAAPPVAIERLQATLEAFQAAVAKANHAAAEARQATRQKRETLKRLVSEMKTNIRYAENTCANDHVTLKQLGWGGRRPKRSMEAPGQVERLKIVEEGPGWIELSWRKPKQGGEVRAYRIERCGLGSEKWVIAGMATAPSVRLEDQERGVQWMYRVVAVNAVGEGMESAPAEAGL